jgi:hypothetical protein
MASSPENSMVEMEMKLGDKVEPSKMQNGAPPIVIQVQPSGYVKLTTPDEIKEFEGLMHQIYGHRLAIHAGAVACETCSGGCTDDCGML